MDETTTRDLIDRMDRLEAENARLRRNGRWWRLGGAVAVLVAGVFAFQSPVEGQAGDAVTAKKVTAESYRLKGPKGKLRGLWNVSSKGTAALSILGADQKIRTMMTVSAAGRSQFIYLGNDGKLRMTISLDKGGEPAVLFNDNQGQTRMSITTTPTAILCNDGAGKNRAFMGVGKQGGGLFQVKDANGGVLQEIK